MRETVKEFGKKKVVIIGGGPAGLTAAYELSKADVESIVLEKDQMLGGISRTVKYRNFYFDIGGHRFFTKIKRVNDMWKDVLGDNFLRRKRLSRIYYNKKFFFYPLRPINALLGLGLYNSFLVLLSYFYIHTFPLKQEETLEQWVSNRFGRRLYTTFFKTYTEKVWGVPCSEIRAEWAAQRIQGLSLAKAIKNSLVKPQNNNGNGTVIKTLIDSFDYPKLGPGMMWETVAEIVKKNGSQVYLEAEVEGILWDKKRVKSLEVNINGQKNLFQGTNFISSMPIRELIQKFKPTVPEKVLKAANNLKYRDFLTVALIVNKRDVFPDNWIYIHEPDVKLGRIQNFKNWSPYMVPDPGKTCLGLEYFCFEGDDLWSMPDQELIDLGKKELETLDLVRAYDVVDGAVVRMPKAYPVYDSNYKDMLQIVQQFTDKIDNLQLVGRNGMHRYNNQDHSMLTAMLAVENILGANHNLLDINKEEEYHEEDKKFDKDEVIKGTFARMDKLGLATATGSVSGLLIFLATLWLVIKGGEVIGPNLQLLNSFFIGYTVTLKGAFIGFANSFIWGFLAGWLFANLRNLTIAFYIYRVKRKIEMHSFRDFMEHF
jgi:protoporphyrinogen oxidase